LQAALYLIGAVSEGTSVMFGTRGRSGALYLRVKRAARAALLPLLEALWATADRERRPRAVAQRARTVSDRRPAARVGRGRLAKTLPHKAPARKALVKRLQSGSNRG